MNRTYCPRFAAALAMTLLMAMPVALATPVKEASLTVRFISAEQREAASSDRGLSDILPLLKSNLRYNSYSLISRHAITLGDGTSASLGYGYKLSLSDTAGTSATVRVDRDRERLVKTRLQLEPGRPIILGGFQKAEGVFLIIVIELAEHPR